MLNAYFVYLRSLCFGFYFVYDFIHCFSIFLWLCLALDTELLTRQKELRGRGLDRRCCASARCARIGTHWVHSTAKWFTSGDDRREVEIVMTVTDPRPRSHSEPA